MQTSWHPKPFILDILLTPWGTIWESFLPLGAQRTRTVHANCNLEAICEKTLVHFGHHFDPKVDKSNEKLEKYAPGKQAETQIDFRTLPDWPNVAPTL